MPDNEQSISQRLGEILADQLKKQAQKRLPPGYNPASGMDNAISPPPLPQRPAQAFVPTVRGSSLVLPLPANQGANFEGYANLNWHATKPLDVKMNDIGIRYRYPF